MIRHLTTWFLFPSCSGSSTGRSSLLRLASRSQLLTSSIQKFLTTKMACRPAPSVLGLQTMKPAVQGPLTSPKSSYPPSAKCWLTLRRFQLLRRLPSINLSIGCKRRLDRRTRTLTRKLSWSFHSQLKTSSEYQTTTERKTNWKRNPKLQPLKVHQPTKLKQ